MNRFERAGDAVPGERFLQRVEEGRLARRGVFVAQAADGAVEQGGRLRLRQTLVRSHFGFVVAHQIVEFLVFHTEDLKLTRSFSRA